MADEARTELTNLILDEFDDEDHDILLPVLHSGFGLYADKAAIAPRLRYCYLVRRCIDKLLRTKYKDVDYDEAGVDEKLGQMARQLQQMREDAQADIDAIEKSAKSGRAGAVGTLTRTAPMMPLAGQFDANDPGYRGSPFRKSV